eukprot:2244578-Rhodomonas_salina.1
MWTRKRCVSPGLEAARAQKALAWQMRKRLPEETHGARCYAWCSRKKRPGCSTCEVGGHRMARG